MLERGAAEPDAGASGKPRNFREHGDLNRNVPIAEPSDEGGFWRRSRSIIQALAIALVIRTLLFQPFNIPSGSMIPTLLIGDYVFVSKYCLRLLELLDPLRSRLVPGRILGAEPKRGDVVVFKLPRDNETDYIKRVIGLPGDHIQMIDGPALHQQRHGPARADRQGAHRGARRARHGSADL